MKLVSTITYGVIVALLCSCSPREAEIRDKTHKLLTQLEQASTVSEEMQYIEQLRAMPRSRAYYETFFADSEGKPVTKEEFYKAHNANPQLRLKLIFRYTNANGKSHTFVRAFINEDAFKFYFMPQ